MENEALTDDIFSLKFQIDDVFLNICFGKIKRAKNTG